MFSRRAGVLAAAAALLASGLAVSAGADAKRSTDCERAGSKTRIETAGLRIYDVRRGSTKAGFSKLTYACRKGTTRKPILLYDTARGEGGYGSFVVLNLRVATTSLACTEATHSCVQRARLLDMDTGHSLYGPAAPAGGDPAVWQAVRALPARSGALVYSAQTPVEPTPDRPLVDARIAVVATDGTTRELDRGKGVEADTLAVAQQADNQTLVTWRSGGALRSAEL
jgi:hypothetical protein